MSTLIYRTYGQNRPRPMRRLRGAGPHWVFTLTLLLSCATSPTIIAGQAVDTLEQTYTAVGNEMNRGLKAGYVSPSAYEKWADVAPKLKASIHLAKDLWLSTKDVEDAAAADRVQILLAGVRAQLDAFMADIAQAVTAFSARDGGAL